MKNARYTILLPFLDSSGSPSDPVTPDSEISEDGGAFTDAAEEVTTISGSNGVGFLTLTGAETDCSMLAVAAKVASGPKNTLLTIFPRVLPVLESGTAQTGAAGTLTLAAGAAAYTLVGCILRTTGGTGGGGTGGANNQARLITAYNTSTKVATVTPNWETTPDVTTTYEVHFTEMAVNSIVGRFLRPTVDERTIDVTATGAAGLDWGNVENPTTTVGLTGTTVDLVANAVDSTAIATGAITNAKFAAGAIDATAIANAAIDAATFAAGAIDATAIATDAITAAKIANGAIDAATFASGAIDAAAFAAGAITAAAIANGAIDAATFAAGAIDAAAIADGAIDAATFAAGAITATVIATGAIDADALAADAVAELRAVVSGTADSGSTSTLVDAARTEADTDYWKGSWVLFTSGTIAGQSRLITGFNAATDTLTFAPVTTQAVGTNTYEILPSGAVNVQQWLAATVNALISGRVDVNVQAMANDVITAAVVANAAIDAATFAAGAIDAAAIANGAIDAATFAAGAIDAAAIAADAIGASELAAGAATKIRDTILSDATPFPGGSIDAAISTRATPAQVNTEVLDVLNVDTFAEPGQVTPAATSSLVTKISFLFKYLRNRVTVDATTISVYNDDATTVGQKSTHSDSGTVYDRGEYISGP